MINYNNYLTTKLKNKDKINTNYDESKRETLWFWENDTDSNLDVTCYVFVYRLENLTAHKNLMFTCCLTWLRLWFSDLVNNESIKINFVHDFLTKLREK